VVMATGGFGGEADSWWLGLDAGSIESKRSTFSYIKTFGVECRCSPVS
jgi:hypothetical protein